MIQLSNAHQMVWSVSIHAVDFIMNYSKISRRLFIPTTYAIAPHTQITLLLQLNPLPDAYACEL